MVERPFLRELWFVLQACSFLLSNAEQLDYGELYKSCITLLLAGTAVDKVKPKLSLLVSSFIVPKIYVHSVREVFIEPVCGVENQT